MIVSQGGVGKSGASIKIAMIYVEENPEKKVALWLTEDSEGETYRRYKQLIPVFNNDAKFFNDRVSFITSPPQRLTKMEDGNAVLTKEFHEVRDDLSEYSLIILDPLLQFNGCDENSNTYAGVLMGALKTWSSKDKKEILLLHHVTLFQDGSIKARGASEWQNGCRCVYSVAYPCSLDGKADRAASNRIFELIKDNGIGYRYFTNSSGNKERELEVFPEKDTPL